MTSKPAITDSGTAWQISGPENAPVIALIHGLGLNRHIWQQHELMLAQEYRVLNYDLYGHGDSARLPSKASLTLFSEQLLELLDAVAIDCCVLVGFSLGGMINRRFSLDHADRVSALVILDSPHERGLDAQKLVEQRAADTASGGPGANLDTTIERWFTPSYRSDHPQVIQQVRAWVMANDDDSYAQSRQVLAEGVVELIRPPIRIKKPALVMTCQNDSGSTVAMTHAIASEIVGAETIIVPGLQHMGLLESPGLFTEPILQFLRKAQI